MSLWILDTVTITLWQNQHPLIKQHIEQRSFEEIAITVITIEEQTRGWLNAIRQNSVNPTKLRWAYLGLHQGVEFVNRIQILDFDERSSNNYKRLKDMKFRIGTLDLRIASIALAFNAVLVTSNHRDFNQVPDLQLEDWTRDN